MNFRDLKTKNWFIGLIAFLSALFTIVGSTGMVVAADSSLPNKWERNFDVKLETLEAAKTDQNNANDGKLWQLRSNHFLFGMPRLVDERHKLHQLIIQRTNQASLSLSVRLLSLHTSTE